MVASLYIIAIRSVTNRPTANRPPGKMKDSMSQRTWFITGISSGFGRYTTEQLLERGPVAVTFRNLEAVDDLKRQYGATRERTEGGAYLPPGDPAKMIRAAD